MASKGKKLGYSEVKSLEQMSLSQLKDRFDSLAQSAEARRGLADSASPISKTDPNSVKAPALADLDLGGNSDGLDIQGASVEDLAQRFLDPATLEARPEYADGSAPETAIMKSPSGSMWERTKLAFTNKSLEDQVKILEKEYGQGNVQLSRGRNLTVKQNGAWYQLDPSGAGQGDFWDKAMERTQDVLADNADLAVGLGVGIATAGAAAPLAAGLTGLAAVGGAAGVGAASGAGSAMGRILMGRLAGTYDASPEEMMKEIGVESLLGLAGQAFIPGVKYGARELGAKFIKAAPVIGEAAPGVKDAMAKVMGYTSGVGEEVADQWINNTSKVGQQIAKYGKDEQAAIIANINQTKEIAEGVVEARRKFGRELYGTFAEEAGDKFAPNVGKIFSRAANPSVSGEASMAVDLVDSGILKWDNIKGVLNVNSVDDIIKANPTTGSIFTEPEARKLLEPVVRTINAFNKLAPASGKEGAEQFLAFKNRLGTALRQVQAEAEEKGLMNAYGEISKMSSQVKSAYLNRAVDGAKHPELMAKLVGIDKQYADMKNIIRPFEDAVAKGNKQGLDGFKSLYDNTFAGVNLTSKKAIAKNQLQQTLQTLGKYKPELTELVDDIGARKAALASVPWFRKGLVGQAAALGSVTTLNPAVITGAAMTSPKLNFEAAKLAGSMYRGLEFIRGMSPEMKKQFLKTPQAVNDFYKTVISVPGLEAQISSQLGNQLRGGQNGQ